MNECFTFVRKYVCVRTLCFSLQRVVLHPLLGERLRVMREPNPLLVYKWGQQSTGRAASGIEPVSSRSSAGPTYAALA